MKTFMVFLFAAVLFPAHSEAANEGGHGGGAIVCIQPDGTLKADLLDLVEKKEAQDGGTLTPNSLSEAAQLEAALVKFARAAPRDVEKMRLVLAALNIQPVAAGQQLVPPSDTGLRVMRRHRNCSLQGLADFDDLTGILTVDPELLAALDSANLAALKFHEALYKVWRGQPVKAPDSLMVRKVTGAVFADQPLDFVAPDADRLRARYECEAGDAYRFLVVEQAAGALEMQFTRYAGRPVIGRMAAAVQFDPVLFEQARRAMGVLPDSEAAGRTAIEDLGARLRDGFWHGALPARRGQTDPSHYAPLPFHYEVALRAHSEYEPSPAFLMWGGDFFTDSDSKVIGVNHHAAIFSLTSSGQSSRWQGVISCHRP